MPKGTGSEFERSFSIEFSRWLTRNLEKPRDDVVWRSAGSGSRSTLRGRKGKATHGSTGDLEPTDPLAEPFFKACSVELKYGYGGWCVLDVLDKRGTTAKCEFEKFWEQAVRQAKTSNPVKHPILITRRTTRRVVLTTTKTFFSQLVKQFGVPQVDIIFIRLYNPNLSQSEANLVLIKMADFYEWVDPNFFVDSEKAV